MRNKSVPIKVLNTERKPISVLAVRRMELGVKDVFVLHRAVPGDGSGGIGKGWSVTHVRTGLSALYRNEGNMSKAAQAAKKQIEAAGVARLRQVTKGGKTLNSKEVREKCRELFLYSPPVARDPEKEPKVLAILPTAEVAARGLPVTIVKKGSDEVRQPIAGKPHETRMVKRELAYIRVGEHKGFSGFGSREQSYGRISRRVPCIPIRHKQNSLAGFEFWILRRLIGMVPQSETKAL